MKDKVRKVCLRKTELLGTKLFNRNLIQKLNSLAVSIVKYSLPFLKLSEKELRNMVHSTSKLLTMHSALYLNKDIDGLCQENKVKKDSAAMRIQELEGCTKRVQKKWLQHQLNY